MQPRNHYFFFFFSDVDYSELDVNMTMVDDEATLTMVEDLYLSASEEAVPAERNTLGSAPQNLGSVFLGNNAEQHFDRSSVPMTPLPRPPEQLTP